MNHGGLGRDVVVVVAAASVGVLIRGGERASKKGEKRNETGVDGESVDGNRKRGSLTLARGYSRKS